LPALPTPELFEYGTTTTGDGTGLGLAIVADVAEAHGWTIQVCESDAGGAQFEFEFDD
jgi:signal transduction histidine kinase